MSPDDPKPVPSPAKSAPSAAKSAPAAEKSVNRKRAERDSFLETIESLVVAFILAFVFRAYVVEAFVIPTGSMAPKLLGQHMEVTCANCGHHYRVGVDEGKGVQLDPTGDGRQPFARCPLCMDNRVTESKPGRFFGDRILVLKYFYDFFPPERWDVIVFKYPIDPTQNYIKRLVALPGETIEIRDGDVYINNQIAQKTDKAQKALWMPVADTDYWDRNNGSLWRPLATGPQDLWQWQQMPMTLTPRGNEAATLRYHHLGPDGRPWAIRDSYGYDNPTTYDAARRARSDGSNVVTDIELVADLQIDGPGVVELTLEAAGDTFVFRFPSEGSRQSAQVFRNDRLVGAAGPMEPLPVGRRVCLEASNVDHKLIMKVDGRRLTADMPYELDDRANWVGSDLDMNDIRLGASGAPVTVHRLRINRDIYYTSEPPDPTRPGHWGVEGQPYTLGKDAFFVLGDNSPRSLDSRWWNIDEAASKVYREGRTMHDSPVIPRRNLVGKAFFVYWPAAGARYGVQSWMRFVPALNQFRFIR